METYGGKPVAGGQGNAGFSLIEGVVAAALLLVIAVSILPIFTNAINSNLSGGRSSQLSTFVSGDIETVNQAHVDQDAWAIAGSPSGILRLANRFWDIGPLYDTNVANHLGDEKWVAGEDDASGPITWYRGATIRKYSLADIQIIISSDSGGVVTGGSDPLTDFSPMLFDNPLTDDSGAHLTEFRVTIKERREALPGAAGKRMTVGHFRTF